MSCVFQNLAGLQNRYPQNLWQEIIGNCDAQLFLGCTDQLTAEFISARTGLASVAVSSKSKQLGTWRISNYTPEFRETSGVGKRPVLTPDEVLRLPLDQALIIIRGKKVLQVDKMDLLKDLERIRAKLKRHIEKEAADREAEFEAAMQYHSESDIQEAYGWEFISEQQYERYLELFRQGRKALDEHSPTVTELALSILNRIFQDIDRDCRQCEFEALSPEEQLAELKRAEESKQAWRQYIASLKEWSAL